MATTHSDDEDVDALTYVCIYCDLLPMVNVYLALSMRPPRKLAPRNLLLPSPCLFFISLFLGQLIFLL